MLKKMREVLYCLLRLKSEMRFLKSNWFVFATLFLIVLIAYGQTLHMYFLIDDNALIYKLQHFNQEIGLWGKGVSGEGPYRHIVDQFIPFYPVFGINPVPYFGVGILLYFLTAAVLYLFLKVLTKNGLIAFASAAIFAAGYIGSETMFGIVNSWQTTRGLIMALVTFWLFYKYIKTRNTLYYLLSIILFFFSLDTVYIRAHGLVFSIFVFDLLFWPVAFRLRSVLSLLGRQVPFITIHYYIYFSSLNYANQFGILHLLNDIFVGKKYYLATIPIQDIGNLFIPSFFTSYITRLFRQPVLSPEFLLGSFLAGIFILCLVIYLVYKNFRRDNFLTKVLIFSFSFSISNFIVFWLRETNHILGTTHRYFFYSLAGVSLFWATTFYLFAFSLVKERNSSERRNLFKFLSTALVIVLLLLGANHQKEFNQKRSFPEKRFFSAFSRAVPTISKGSVMYFDLANSDKAEGEFGRFFGGIFSAGSYLAIYDPKIDYMKDFTFTQKFDDILSKLAEGKTSIDKVFTFYYGENGLLETTSRTREILSKGAEVKLPVTGFSSNTTFDVSGDSFMTETAFNAVNGVAIGENPVPVFAFGDNLPSLVPSTLSFSLVVTPKMPPFPYRSKSGKPQNGELEKSKIFAYLLSRNSFRKTAVATSASFWKNQEPKFAIDSRPETTWRGHRGYWNDIAVGNTKNIEYFGVDLKKVLTVSTVKWISAQKPLVPIHYRILTSLDGKQWSLAREIKNTETLPEGTVVFDSFSPVIAKFVKMEILKTYGNDGPEIKEFEVVESRFSGLVLENVARVESEPFGQINSMSDYKDATAYVRQDATMKVYFMSSADSKQDPTRYVDVPLVVDGRFHAYSVPLPATGQNWVKLTINGFNFPAEIMIKNPTITYEPAHAN